MKKIHVFIENAKVRIKKQPHDFVGLCWARSTKIQLVKSRRSRGWNPQLVCGMESTRSVVCNQSKEDTRWRVMPYAFGDYILTCGEITCQSFGLDRKKTVRKRSFFSWCRWTDSNRHGGLVHRILSPARLPISPHRRK